MGEFALYLINIVILMITLNEKNLQVTMTYNHSKLLHHFKRKHFPFSVYHIIEQVPLLLVYFIETKIDVSV